ncbi:leukocyte immunoglobulin-like receptor subfamily B member 2 isoform X2 [Clarias gariepinus]|uniref:leukocyte immunoglobulin-like receptor subfamily B member 2 isoform X2 n=1 Tax=Clarias gariepinus TaxID=13013 RepID=UPI00234C0C47|nr:leukocyte immunoglobulin-like receptor subfamily B member 2 isoform X2 [Clarias gariepinus]
MELCPLPVTLLLISLIAVAHAQGNPKAAVSITPDTHVFKGERAFLRCDIQGGGNTEWIYSWYKNNSPRDTQGGHGGYSTRTMQEFTVWSKYSDSGDYTCRGESNSQSSEISDAVTLTVSVRPKPVASIRPDNQVFSRDAVTLRCDIQDESVSNWQYSWYKDAAHSPVSSEQLYRIRGVKVTDTGNYTCRGTERGGSRTSHFSDALTLTVSERPEPVLSVSPQSWLTEGDSVTLKCEVTDSSTDWTFSWYRVPYRDGLTQIKPYPGYIMYVELLSDSSRGSGGSYTLSPAALKHTGVYMCRGERGEPALHTQYSNLQPLWITGKSPQVSLIINPSRTQHFTDDSLSLSCDDQSNSTGWTVRQYTHSEGVSDCLWWGSITGSTCKISSLSTFYTGVYWCESESGETSNPVNITVHGIPKAVVSITPDTHVFSEECVTLRCDLHEGRGTQWTYSWKKNNESLSTKARNGVYTDSTKQEFIIWSVEYSDSGDYTCRGHWSESQSSEISDMVTLAVSAKPKPTLIVSLQSSIYGGDTITLSCELQQSTGWRFLWYRNNQQLQLQNFKQADTNTLTVAVDIAGETEYQCCAHRTTYHQYYSYHHIYFTERSDPVKIKATGESPPVSLIINPSRTQHFTGDSLSLSCEDQRHFTGWTVRRYTHSEGVLDCPRWGSVTGSTCNISSLSTSYTGVYWCGSEIGETSNPVNITVYDGNVILESPVHPVTEGHPLTLRCLYRYTKPSNLRANFHKNGSVLQTQTTGEMIIYKVSKSDEGFYHCKYTGRGESLKSWVSVRGSKPTDGTVGLSVGLSLFFILIVFLILMIVFWYYKIKKENQQESNQSSKQNQSRLGPEDSKAGHTQLQAESSGEAAAESSESTYVKVKKEKKTNRNTGADAKTNGHVMYAELELKPMKKAKKVKENFRVDDETVYSELQQ